MTIIIFILIIAVLILAHEFGHFIVAKKAGMKVEEFGIGFPPKLFSWKPKKSDTTYSINAIPFGGFVKILGENADEKIPEEEKKRSFGEKSAVKRSLVLVAGVTANFILAWLLIAIALMVGTQVSTSQVNSKYIENPQLTITSVLPETPASEAGFMPGDKIIYIEKGSNFVQNPTTENLSDFIQESNGEEISILIRREENQLIKVSPEEGLLEGAYAIGIAMDEVGLAKLPPYIALFKGLEISARLIWIITVSLAGFIVTAFRGAASLNQLTGPVGIASLAGASFRLGISALISFTALISLHLAVLNLLPIPALDGGRLLFIIIEKIKGSRVNPKIETWINGIGFILLIILMLIVTYNDILRLF